MYVKGVEIRNPEKVLESWDLGLSNHAINCYLCWRCQRLFWPSTPPTCFNIHSIWVSAFQNFFRIENWLNIKKVMSKDVQDHFELLSTPLTYIALRALYALLTPLTYIALQPLLYILSYFQHLRHTLWSLYLCIYFICTTVQTLIERSHCYSMQTQWLPHYLIWSRSHCKSNLNQREF